MVAQKPRGREAYKLCQRLLLGQLGPEPVGNTECPAAQAAGGPSAVKSDWGSGRVERQLCGCLHGENTQQLERD